MLTVPELLEMHSHRTNKSPTQEEILLLYSVIRTGRVQTVLECGTHFGMSTIWAATALEENGAEGKVYTFDGLDRPFLYKGMDIEDRIVFRRGPFEHLVGDAIARYNPPHPWFVFIDGAWRYDPNKAYFDAVEPHLQDGDYVMWHDTGDANRGRGLHAKEQGAMFFRAVNGVGLYQHGTSRRPGE